MAKIQDRKYGRRDGGYTRLFGIADLGALMSKIHATTISGGCQLENMIWERVPNKIDNLDDFIEHQISHDELDTVFVASKQQVKKCRWFDTELEPDFMVIKSFKIYAIEVKDGDTFDTKKSQGEQDNMTRFTHEVSANAPYVFETIMCSFNAKNKEKKAKKEN